MIDLAMDRGGLKDSENALNSFFPKINRTLFWRLGTDMLYLCWFEAKKLDILEKLKNKSLRSLHFRFFLIGSKFTKV